MEKPICIAIEETDEGFYAYDDLRYEPADSDGVGGGTFAFATMSQDAVADLLEVS